MCTEQILELDFGNSSLKWRLVGANGTTAVQRMRLEALNSTPPWGEAVFSRVRCSSVIDREALDHWLVIWSIADKTCVVSSADPVSGYCSAYRDQEKLGVDRWLAALAAHRDSGGKNCLVLDMGTAITVDFMGADGCFAGGYILAGRELLLRALNRETAQVRFAEVAAPEFARAWPNTTAQAVLGGVQFVMRAVVQSAMARVSDEVGNGNFVVYLTGGDAIAIAMEMGNAVQYRPDLVLDGLAVALP